VFHCRIRSAGRRARGRRAGREADCDGGGRRHGRQGGRPRDADIGCHGKCDAATHHESAGGHFNPTKAEHGFLAAKGPHAGDMPNQYVGRDGVLRAQIFDGMVSLDGKNDGVRGRALMVHANSDDYRSQPSGDAGDRVACGVIK
jgi:Cu-Zn family superoxide dismutase